MIPKWVCPRFIALPGRGTYSPWENKMKSVFVHVANSRWAHSNTFVKSSRVFAPTSEDSWKHAKVVDPTTQTPQLCHTNSIMVFRNVDVVAAGSYGEFKGVRNVLHADLEAFWHHIICEGVKFILTKSSKLRIFFTRYLLPDCSAKFPWSGDKPCESANIVVFLTDKFSLQSWDRQGKLRTCLDEPIFINFPTTPCGGLHDVSSTSRCRGSKHTHLRTCFFVAFSLIVVTVEITQYGVHQR